MLDSKKEREELLQQILAEGEMSGTPPKPPPNGIPKQWLPSPVRFFLKICMVPFIYLDLGAQKIARVLIPPPFKKAGSCKLRGTCCYYILLPQSKGFLSKIVYFWHTQVNGFFPREKTPYFYDEENVLLMGCRYLKNNKCTQYLLRPMICRKWPIIEHFGYPRIMKGCGYKAVLRKQSKSASSLPILQEESEDH